MFDIHPTDTRHIYFDCTPVKLQKGPKTLGTQVCHVGSRCEIRVDPGIGYEGINVRYMKSCGVTTPGRVGRFNRHRFDALTHKVTRASRGRELHALSIYTSASIEEKCQSNRTRDSDITGAEHFADDVTCRNLRYKCCLSQGLPPIPVLIRLKLGCMYRVI